MDDRYNKVEPEDLERFRKLVGAAHVLTEGDEWEKYARDETEHLRYPPEVGLRPATTQEVSELLRHCYERRLPVTARGGGTGMSGGALPVYGGVVLSLERMNRIVELDTANLMAVVEPGVITQRFQEEVEKQGLFYGPDPASRGSCFMGGNVAECAGGPRALKYGVTKDWILGVEAVLADGRIIECGGKLLKNVTGYNLTQLLVGSEGTLAVITKLITKLLPLARYRRTMLVPFDSAKAAAQALAAVFHGKVIPCAAELMERSAVEAAERQLGRRFPGAEAEAVLLIEVDGHETDEVERQVERVGEACLQHEAREVLLATSSERQEELWELRRAIGEALKSKTQYKDQDTVVPRAQVPELLEAVQRISSKHRIKAVCFGHAGDGNVHVNLLKLDKEDREWEEDLPKAAHDLFQEVVRLGGMITGEHGVGLVLKPYLHLALGKAELELMRGIKQVFDPRGILNPGKIFPDDLAARGLPVAGLK